MPPPEAAENPEILTARAEELVAGGLGVGDEIDAEAVADEAVRDLGAEPLAAAALDLVAGAVAPASPDLAEAVQKLVEATPAAAPAAESAKAPERIADLDAQIADLADNLIAGDLADEEGALKGEVGAPPAPAASAAPVAPEPVAEPAREETREAKTVEAAVPDLKPSPAPPAAPVPPPTPTLQQARPQPAAPKQEKQVKARTRRPILAPLSTKVLALMSAPIRNKSKSFRDTVGWAALVTVFNAGCLWAFVLFFRSPHTPAPVQHAAAHEAGHGKAADDHGKAADHGKSDGHGKTADKGKSHGKADAHGKGGHGAEKKAKPTKTAAKKPSKSKAQASGGHGGGH